MSRWINIDDICIPSDENDWHELVAFADAVAEQEPIDLVRCRECKYWDEPKTEDRRWCDTHNGYTPQDYYCADGERKESE